MSNKLNDSAVLEQIRDQLFLDLDNNDQEFYNMNKEWNSDTIEEIAEIVREHFQMETVICHFCNNEVLSKESHLHQGYFIGECCWDERLRVTE